jgi:L-lactate dehydrogenase (cytochrome)/glycolate oxidase
MDFVFDPTISYEDLRWIRTQWSGHLVVKGVQRVDDAIAAVDAGADAIILSNHGGRQIDRAVVPYTLIPDVVAAVGKRAEVHMDTGIMHGADVIAAIASGANFTWAGRAYLYGLMAGGRAGVDRSLEILRSQMLRTMKLLGARDLSELNPDHVSYLRKM